MAAISVVQASCDRSPSDNCFRRAHAYGTMAIREGLVRVVSGLTERGLSSKTVVEQQASLDAMLLVNTLRHTLIERFPVVFSQTLEQQNVSDFDSLELSGLEANIAQALRRALRELGAERVAAEMLIEVLAPSITHGLSTRLMADPQKPANDDIAASDWMKSFEKQRMLALEAAHAAVDQRIDSALPSLIAQFLRQWWVLHLASVWHPDRGDAAHSAWRDGIATMDALVWSVSVKDGAQISSLASRLPALINALQSALIATNMPQDERTGFFRDLMRLHVHMMTQLKATQPAGMVVTPRPAQFDEWAQGLDRVAQESAQRNARLSIVDGLQRGMTVYLQNARGRCQHRVIWVSPLRTVFILSSRGLPTVSYKSSELRALEKSGALSTVDMTNPLLDDVMDQAMNRLIGGAGDAPLA